ncbi:MAG: PPC domain-containing protein [Gemmataceae bacterium]|nr:PPC domain-containing protein [Gemmataceae bacterium]MCI0738125.1 PPC domain-containing protein [Gemmataceae bacterium]
MKRMWLVLGAFGLTLALSNAASAGDKVLEVGKDGIKIDGKVSADDTKVNLKVGDKELPMPAKMFQVKMGAGKAYTITMNTNDADFDPFVIVHDKDGKQLAFDDDSGGQLNSLLKFSPAKDGTYKVFAASLTGGAGPFTLKITEAASADPKKVHEVGKGGLNLTGNLTQDNKAITYQVKLQEGKTYRIDLLSKQFDCFLTLQNPNGEKLAEDDDGGDGLNSRITHKAAANGNYRIVATSLGMLGTGGYVLQVREMD